jgi:hypothetical protein
LPNSDVCGRNTADVIETPRNPEVSQMDSVHTGIRLGQQDVRGLNVTMQQTALMRVVECLRNRRDDRKHRARRHSRR